MVKVEHGQLTDIRQSDGFARFMKEIGWSTDTIGSLRVFSKKIFLFGTVIRIPRPSLPLPLEEIDQLARDKQALLVKIEPNLLTDGFNPRIMGEFRKDQNPILPTRTIWVDLTKPPDRIFASFDKDTRNLIRRAEKERVGVFESKDLGSFYQLWEKTAKKKGFFIPFESEMKALWKSFPKRHLLIATHQGRPIAAALLFGHGEAMYYYFAASNELGRKYYAAYKLMWESITRSKKLGYTRLDLEGIEDPTIGRTKSWSGFTRFKKGFGGQEIRFAGSFSKYYSPFGKLIGRFL